MDGTDTDGPEWKKEGSEGEEGEGEEGDTDTEHHHVERRTGTGLSGCRLRCHDAASRRRPPEPVRYPPVVDNFLTRR
ncbi:hypothetical protein GCM10010510_71080 [Streptomyces anandii JCM 4720]|nr:hypothetical protein GCM10010510_71080 [Streptomyces anandii JCM 4720]